MRWLPTLIFSPSSHSSSSHSSAAAASASASSSSSSSVPTLKTSTSSSHLVDVNRQRKKHPSADATRGAWLFGSGKRSTRSKKLRPVGDNDETEDDAVVPVVISPPTSDRAFIRSYTSSSSYASVAPQPLPLPELTSAALLRHRDADRTLPSPKDTGRPSPSSRALDDRDHKADGAADPAPTGFRMRSVFASTRRNTEPAETRPPGIAPQDRYGGASYRRDNDFRISVPTRSAPTSPFESPTFSPHHKRNDDFVPYHYVPPKVSHFWSAPEMATSELAGLPPAFFDFSALGADNNYNSNTNNNSPRQGSPGISPRQNSRSPTRPSSPMAIPRLSLDTLKTRREGIAPLIVHPLPLPLPPWAGTGLPSPPSSNFSQAGGAKTESLSMKNQWQKGKLIGRGTFGSVYVATNRETGALCAMKEAEIYSDDPKSAECIKQLEQEIKVLSNLKHPNIVQYYGSEIVEDKFYIYLEYVHPGSINKYVRDHCGAITESVVRNFTRHILSGLAYLHSKKTIHRDIKGANLLVDSSGVVKLADFGMSKHLTGHAADLSLKGSPYWMAPELMHAVMQKDNSSDLAFAIDIWSLGCTIIEMLTGKPPWSEYEGAAAMFKVMKDTPPIPETLSSDGKDFLRQCFIRNPAERPSALMLLDHRFLRS